MNVSLIEPAYFELKDAIEYYNQEISGLGDNFYKELLSTISLIKKFPQACTNNSYHTRKIVLKIFPYKIIYTIWNKEIYIIAIAHQHREPDYWIERMNEFNWR
ncbi:MAG: type II toxin-antitoxin system RelE/ParE family toxin [Candidatus Firestonebacteria bacterium]|nr:type II toxin-antitoxin system RelE/ParE family toxin [Candidatus Firestonebacteria bacterium]